jgi:transposase-like protein
MEAYPRMLTAKDVADIQRIYLGDREVTLEQLAKKYGCHSSTIWNAVHERGTYSTIYNRTRKNNFPVRKPSPPKAKIPKNSENRKRGTWSHWKSSPPNPRRFSPEVVEQIRELYNQKKSYRELANEFDCHHSTIEHIIRRKGVYRS